MTAADAPTAVPPARIWPAALIVWALVAGFLLMHDTAGALKGFSDTDDATRMVMVRELLHGRGWWDQTLWRLQAPRGVVMHWSRLLDGALAALDGGFSSLLGEGRGEMAMRLLWPMLLIGPTVAACLAVTRDLVGDGEDARPALLACAAACAVGLPLYAQFHPGRIDHHNVQLLLWLVAWAGAGARGPTLGGAIAGAAMGLGLAIGLEALVFYFTIAAFVALRFAWDADGRTRLRAFAGALLAVSVTAFLIQTPPARWGVPVCDALAPNLVAGMAAGALALLAASVARLERLGRFLAVGAAGGVAAAVYLALDPHCLHGPFADVDPAIRPIWLSGVQEMEPVWALLKSDRPTALALLVTAGMGLAGWAALVATRWRSARRLPSPALVVAGLMLAAAIPQALSMLRAGSYLYWAATPPLALAAAKAAAWMSDKAAVDRARVALLALVLSPTVEASLALSALQLATPAAAASLKSPADRPDHCFEQASYARLAALPSGRVLAEPDLGPFVIAYTGHGAISAPYHRMAYGLLAGHAAFAAPVADARARVAALGADYVLACPAHDTRYAMGKASLETAIQAHRTPAWLKPLSPPHASLQIYEVMR